MSEAAPAPSRMVPLDALRGWAVLMMIFSAAVPWGTLPAWMYHAQVPPPDMKFDPNVPGITWVDLVFPFFIFAMGAAIPFAFGRRIEKGPWWSVVGAVLERGAGLLFFAVFVQHFRPGSIDGSYGPRALWLCLAAFVVLMLVFVRTPREWPRWQSFGVRAVGWVLAAWMLWSFRTEGGDGFSWGRSDIIIAVLANLAVAGPIVWWATRTGLLGKALVMGAVAAMVLASGKEGLARSVWMFAPWPGLIDVGFLKYLLVLIPGIMVGDHLRQPTPEDHQDPQGDWVVALLGLALLPIVVVGLFAREVVPTTLTALALSAAAWAFARSIGSRLAFLAGSGTAWLMLGLLMEPFQDGIKKDPAHFSYYFVTAGLACWFLLFLTVANRLDRRKAGVVALAGANPLMAYVGMNNLIDPVLRLAGIHGWVNGLALGPWGFAAYGALRTLLMALVVAGFTYRRVQWRA